MQGDSKAIKVKILVIVVTNQKVIARNLCSISKLRDNYQQDGKFNVKTGAKLDAI